MVLGFRAFASHKSPISTGTTRLSGGGPPIALPRDINLGSNSVHYNLQGNWYFQSSFNLQHYCR